MTGTAVDDRSDKAADRKLWQTPCFAVLADIEDTSKVYDLFDFSESQGPS